MTEESNTAPPAPEAVEVVRTEAGLKPAFSKEDIEPVIPVDGEQQEQEQAAAPPPDHLPPNDGTHEVSFDDADADADARDAENDVVEENGDDEEVESDSDPYDTSEVEEDDGGAYDASEAEEAPVSEEELRYTELEVLTEKIAAAKLELAQIEEEKKAAEASAHATKADIDSAIAEADLRLREVQQKINGLQADFDNKADAQSSDDTPEPEAAAIA